MPDENSLPGKDKGPRTGSSSKEDNNISSQSKAKDSSSEPSIPVLLEYLD